MDWMKDKGPVRQMVFDKPTSLFAWVTNEGKAYAVRKPGVISHSINSTYDIASRIQEGTEIVEGVAFP